MLDSTFGNPLNTQKLLAIKDRLLNQHCVKSVHIWNSSGPYFSTFGLITPYLSLFSPNARKYEAE